MIFACVFRSSCDRWNSRLFMIYFYFLKRLQVLVQANVEFTRHSSQVIAVKNQILFRLYKKLVKVQSAAVMILWVSVPEVVHRAQAKTFINSRT